MENLQLVCVLICTVCFASGARIPRKVGDTKVIGGVDAVPGAWPYQAQLLYLGSHQCGGSLLNNSFVLTARHCVAGDPPSAITIRLGEHDQTVSEGFEAVHTVTEIIEHDDIDVALLAISPAPDLSNPRIKTIEMAREDPPTGTNATLTGWGRTQSSMPGSGADILQVLRDVPIAAQSVCEDDLGSSMSENEICAGFDDGVYVNACHGDSGGPLVIEVSPGVYEEVGIVSWGIGGCPSNYHYAVYVSVAAVRPWVLMYQPKA